MLHVRSLRAGDRHNRISAPFLCSIANVQFAAVQSFLLPAATEHAATLFELQRKHHRAYVSMFV